MSAMKEGLLVLEALFFQHGFAASLFWPSNADAEASHEHGSGCPVEKPMPEMHRTA